MLLVLATGPMFGCGSVSYKQIIVRDQTRTWQTQYSLPPDFIVARVKVALEAAPLSLVVSQISDTELSTDLLFSGRYEGIWPFGSHWESDLKVTILVQRLSGDSKTRVSLQAVHQERPNGYWPWQDAEEYGVAQPQFERLQRIIKTSIEKG